MADTITAGKAPSKLNPANWWQQTPDTTAYTINAGTGNADQMWNQGWTAGYNNSTGSNPYSDVNQKAGFAQGQQDYFKQKGTSTQKTATTPTVLGQSAQTPSSSMGDISNTLQNQINDLYAQNVGIYDTAQQNLASANQLGQEQINTTQTQNARDYTSAWEQAKTLYTNQLTGAGQAQTQATNQNVRNLNALQQQAMSKYGMGSNVGGNLSELIAVEFQRAQGNVHQGYTNSLNAIFGYQAQAQQAFTLAVQKNDEDAALELKKLGQSYTEALANINAQRIQNEQGKTTAKLELLQTLLSQSQAIKDQKQNIVDQLEVWAATQGNNVSGALKLAQQKAVEATSQYNADVSGILNNPDNSIVNQNQTQAPINYLNPQKDTTDVFGNLINPF